VAGMERAEYAWLRGETGQQLSAHSGDLVAHVNVAGAVWKLLGEVGFGWLRLELVERGTWRPDEVGGTRKFRPTTSTESAGSF